MKRTLFLGVIVVAVVFGLVAYATAVSGQVVVSATLNPMTELTIDIPATTFNGGTVDPGASYPSDDTPQVTVKSNVPYTWSEDGIVASSDAAFEAYLSEAGTVDQGTAGSRGVFKKSFEYTLDLTADSVYTNLDPSVLYTATYQYTATP